MQELAKVAIWPSFFSNLKIDLQCDEVSIPIKSLTLVQNESDPMDISTNSLEPTNSPFKPDSASPLKRSNTSETTPPISKKQKVKDPNHVVVKCSRHQLVKIFQKMTTFSELMNKGSVKIQNCTDKVKLISFLDELVKSVMDQVQLTCHRTVTECLVHRTKFFFELSYLWTDKHLQEKGACWAAFTRSSVPQPAWIPNLVENRLEQTGLVANGFLTSSAINIYHTGNLGLLPHFDDAIRFTPPIFSYQPFSSKRLAFGTGFFFFCFCFSKLKTISYY